MQGHRGSARRAVPVPDFEDGGQQFCARTSAKAEKRGQEALPPSSGLEAGCFGVSSTASHAGTERR